MRSLLASVIVAVLTAIASHAVSAADLNHQGEAFF